MKRDPFRPAWQARLLGRTRWRLAIRGCILVTATLAILSAGAYLSVRSAVYTELAEGLSHAGGRLPAGNGGGYLVVGNTITPLPADTLAQLLTTDETRFGVRSDGRYGALAVLRDPLPGGGVRVLATPAGDDARVLAAILLALAALTLGGGLMALPVGYFLAGQALRPLDEAVRARGEFVALASHRLRTPLAVIRTAAELAQSGQGVSPAEALSTVRGQAEHLDELAARLSALTRAESGEIDARAGGADLAEVAGTLVEASREAAERAGVSLEYRRTVSAPVAAGASEAADMLSAPLENALAVTPRGGRVVVQVGTHGRRAVAEVRDTGPGIDEADLRRVFEPFFQGRDAAGRSGLGLTLAKAVAERARGRIEIHSRRGAGTTVRVSLPLAARRRP